MTDIRLPDGTIARFSHDMTDVEIEAVLRKQFPLPRPVSLELGERTKRGNGAAVTFNAVMGRYVVEDNHGKPCGFRLTLDEALDFADALPPPRAPRTVKPEPVTVAMPPEVGNALLASEIDTHIRRSEVRHRREQRQSATRRNRSPF